MKLARQHTDDGPCGAIQRDHPSQDVCFPAASLLPCGVAQDDGARPTRQIFARVEIASQDRCDAERAKESVADARALPGLRTFGGRLNKTGVLEYVQREEGPVHLLPVEVVGVRQIAVFE